MSLFSPSKRQLSIVGLILAGCVACIYTLTVSKTDWSLLAFDKPPGSEILDIGALYLVDEIPISQETLKRTLDGSVSSALEIKVSNLSRRSVDKKSARNFNDQVASIFSAGDFPKSEGSRYAFYVDVSLDQIEKLLKPTIFFHRLPSAGWSVYLNTTLLRHGDNVDYFVAIPLPKDLPNQFRLTFVAQNRNPGRLPGLYFTYGLTIRSGKEASWAQQNLPAQSTYPYIFTSIFLVVFALVGFSMAFSTPKYSDVWSYAAFCGTLAVVVWRHTPFFWGAFEWSESGISYAYDAVRMTFDLCFMLTAVVLNLTFFRIRGHWFKVVMYGAIVSAVYVFYRNFPGWNPGIKSYQAYANIGRAVVVLLIFSQSVGCIIGFKDLFKAWKDAKLSGLTPRVQKIKRRVAYALVFTFGVGIMQYFCKRSIIHRLTGQILPTAAVQ